MKSSAISVLCWYQLYLERRPLITKMVTASVTACIGDILCQTIERRRY